MQAGNPAEGEVRPFEAMVQGPFAALLRVPEDGFSWRDGLVAIDVGRDEKNIPGRWLIGSDSLYTRQYSPLAVSSLHRRFARNEPTAESILAFANEYGFLGHPSWLGDPDASVQAMLVGESLGFWQKEVGRMARLMALWEVVKRGNSRDLSQLVEWTRQDRSQLVRLYLAVVDGKVHPDLALRMRQGREEFWDYFRQNEDLVGPTTYCEMIVLAHEEISGGTELLERWRYGDPVEPARYFVHREVNRRLRGHVSPAVLPFRKGEIRLFPDCLLSSLYTQFLLELSGRSRPAIVCARHGCGRYFEPAHGRQRYCDKRCQQLAYYYRKKTKG